MIDRSDTPVADSDSELEGAGSCPMMWQLVASTLNWI